MNPFTHNIPLHRTSQAGAGTSERWQPPGTLDLDSLVSFHPPATHPARPAATSTAVIARVIEQEIIPRLMRLAPLERLTLPALGATKVTADDVQELAQRVLAPQEDATRACAESLRAKGIPVETIYLDLLAPVARHLGRLWEQDVCGFADLTIGLGRLQQILRQLSPAFEEEAFSRRATDGRVLLLPSPGEQHTFGISMVAEFFRRAGWDVAGGAWEAGADAVTMVRQERFDVVGFSLSAEVHLAELCECIRSVRKATLNPHVKIIVGGPAFVQHPEYMQLAEADAFAADGREALEWAGKLVARMRPYGARGAHATECRP